MQKTVKPRFETKQHNFVLYQSKGEAENYSGILQMKYFNCYFTGLVNMNRYSKRNAF